MSDITLTDLLVKDRWTWTKHGDVRSVPRQATVSDLLEVLRELGAEEVESRHVYDNNGDWDLEVIIVEPGRYLVYHLESE